MTDLKNGILEVNGFEISARTTPEAITKNLADLIWYNSTNNNEYGSICMEAVLDFGVKFGIDLSFKKEKLLGIELSSQYQYEGERTYEKNHQLDIEWLKKLLGEPHEVKEPDTEGGMVSKGITYNFHECRISAVYKDDPRVGDKASLIISYEG